MPNETLLIVSYFGLGTFAVILAMATVALLRGTLDEITEAMRARNVGSLLRRVFPIWVTLITLLGFFSVSYSSCSPRPYQQIIRDRSLLIAKGHELFAASTAATAVALLYWAFIIMVFLILWKKGKLGGTG